MGRIKEVLQEKLGLLVGIAMYAVITIIYLILLGRLNQELLLQQSAGLNNIELLLYRDSVAVKYFFGAVVLIVIAGFLIWYMGYSIIQSNELPEALILLLLILICIFFIILIIKFIMIPILKAILSVIAMGLIAILGLTQAQ